MEDDPKYQRLFDDTGEVVMTAPGLAEVDGIGEYAKSFLWELEDQLEGQADWITENSVLLVAILRVAEEIEKLRKALVPEQADRG